MGLEVFQGAVDLGKENREVLRQVENLYELQVMVGQELTVLVAHPREVDMELEGCQDQKVVLVHLLARPLVDHQVKGIIVVKVESFHHVSACTILTYRVQFHALQLGLILLGFQFEMALIQVH